MQIIYEFSRQEIKKHSVANFQSLFGVDRLREAAKTNPSLLTSAVGSIKIYFQREPGGPLQYEDPDIRALCSKLVDKTAAVLLSSTEDRTLLLLFYCTMTNFEVIHKVPGGHSYGFHSKGPDAIKHLKHFQDRFTASARALGLTKVQDQLSRVTALFPCQ